MAEPFLSEIRIMASPYVPKGWALCNGQLLPINQNQALFSLLGVAYGGDGRVTFALPDLRARTPIHVGSGHSLAESRGEAAHTLSVAELPGHVHAAQATSAAADVAVPTGNLLAAVDNTTFGAAYAGVRATEEASSLVPLSDVAVGNTGGGQGHLNMQPYLTLSFCIALQGIYPSPN